MRVLKKIDKLIVTSLFPPFVLAFFIAVFVLIMQFLWSFIDELVGKGISILDLMEMLFYRSLSLFPLAFPIGILLASVMVFGGLSERYELSSFKSAGVSLLRVMVPAITFSACVALFSIFCSNTLIPLSNLKFESRLYDMRNKKPALNLEEGIFNNDFKGYAINIGKKHHDNRHIEDIVLYDQTPTNRRQFSMVTADKGEMYVNPETREFVMKLYDGYHYQEMDPGKQGSGYPFTRTHFKEWTKKFSMAEFDLDYTPEDLFKSHHMMKSVRQLIYEVDTLDAQYERTLERNLYDFNKITRQKPEEVHQSEPVYTIEPHGLPDSAHAALLANREVRQRVVRPPKKGEVLTAPVMPKADVPKSDLESMLDSLPAAMTLDSVLARLPQEEQQQYLKQAVAIARNLSQSDERLLATLKSLRINKAKNVYELHSKFCFAVICIIFLFIGAPMGAIVRKGGFGYPLLVAVIFFTIFILLTLMFKKLAEAENVDAVLGAWMPCIVMLPISAVLTYKAMNDAKMLNIEPLIRFAAGVTDWLRRVIPQ